VVKRQLSAKLGNSRLTGCGGAGRMARRSGDRLWRSMAGWLALRGGWGRRIAASSGRRSA
jgi:hypothetical protein